MKTIAVVFSLVLFFSSVSAFSQESGTSDSRGPRQLTCGGRRTINDVIGRLRPGDTLSVSGACNENVLIPDEIHNVAIDGQGTATINGPDASTATITIRGNGIRISNFASISGGENGISVVRGGTATIDANVIQNTGTNGILVNLNSSARIINNTIQGNPESGIVLNENSSARIGFLMAGDTEASPNFIQNNGENGITVSRSSNARIVGNTISTNAAHGVLVTRVAHADVSSNVIDANGANGVFVSRNSGVNLGEDAGSGIFDAPNITNANNGQFGVRCLLNSSVDGRLGSLNGDSGPTQFLSGCISGLP